MLAYLPTCETPKHDRQISRTHPHRQIYQYSIPSRAGPILTLPTLRSLSMNNPPRITIVPTHPYSDSIISRCVSTSGANRIGLSSVPFENAWDKRTTDRWFKCPSPVQSTFSKARRPKPGASMFSYVRSDVEARHRLKEECCATLYSMANFYQTDFQEAHDDLFQIPDDLVLAAYKTVDKRIKPVPGVFPGEARITRQFPEDPLTSLVVLDPANLPDFRPTARLTKERLQGLGINKEGFLWPEEERLFNFILSIHDKALAFTEEDKGFIRDDYFSPYIIPVVPHVPWKEGNIPITPGIRDRVVQLLREKIATGLYEPSQASYRSRWFCVLKKNGSLRIVHDLQPLNKVTVRDAGGPPILDDFVEPFAGRVCYTVFDLYSGYDSRLLHESSRDLTSFQTPLGLLRITGMPQGFTNSPAEFQRCMSFVLQDEIPHKANIFIDDLPIKGPETQYLDEEGNPETLSENKGVRRFIWEHAQDVHRIMHRIKHCGAAFSAKKIQLCRPEVVIVGHKCTPAGRVPEDSKVSKILNWPVLKNVKDVRGFLGLCGTVRIWIKDYSLLARPLTELVRKGVTFDWDTRRQEAFELLKQKVASAPALRPLNYEVDRPIILSVDSSYIAVGFILAQNDETGKRVPARYGSLPFNERESRYSQPKLELYGCYRALRHWRLYLVGVKKLVLEVDAKYIKEMLNNPDLQPNASINRWIQGILMFDFELRHVPAEKHKGPDALSRKEPTKEDILEAHQDRDDEEDMVLTFEGNIPSLSKEEASMPSFLQRQSASSVLIDKIHSFLRTLKVPQFKDDSARRRFMRQVSGYFAKGPHLYKRRKIGFPIRVVLDQTTRLAILKQAHEDLGHRGSFGVFAHLKDRFFWPYMFLDVKNHVRTCHPCQLWSVKKVEVPPTISTPSAIFTKIYVDVMFMPVAQGFKYIIAARDELTHVAEGRALKNLKSKTTARFFWEEIICRYGYISEVVTDNGAEVAGAFQNLLERYGIPQIKISPYNKHATGIVEQGHFAIRQAILKDCGQKISSWPERVHLAFFADRVTTRRVTGFSPYYLAHGVHPILPFDLTEASFMIEGYRSGMTSSELLALRMRQLDKREEDVARAADAIKMARMSSKEQFERRFHSRLRKIPLQPGQLVLVRDVSRDTNLAGKYTPRYAGPYEVVRMTKKETYVIKELNGAVLRQGFAGFRLLPYRSRVPSDLHLEEDEYDSDQQSEEAAEMESGNSDNE